MYVLVVKYSACQNSTLSYQLTVGAVNEMITQQHMVSNSMSPLKIMFLGKFSENSTV